MQGIIQYAQTRPCALSSLHAAVHLCRLCSALPNFREFGQGQMVVLQPCSSTTSSILNHAARQSMAMALTSLPFHACKQSYCVVQVILGLSIAHCNSRCCLLAGQYVTEGVDNAYLAGLEESVRLANRKRAGQPISLAAEVPA